ncbi:MAG: hypothetical protein VZQ83_06050 [Eubacterium sp.]|nr:hypothetical protein [Eubacterium sp.]
MKAVSEFVIGTTAVRIVDTGRRIRVIDIEKAKERKQFKKTVVAMIFAATLSFATSLSVVNFHNSQTLLDRQIFSLKTEIDSLERENKALEKENEEKEKLSYAKVLKKATAMGMSFPTKKRVKTYTYKKGSGIRFYKSA